MLIDILLSLIACSPNSSVDLDASPTLEWSVDVGKPIAQVINLDESLAVRTDDGRIIGLSIEGEWQWTLTFTAEVAGDIAPLGPWLAVATADRIHLVHPESGEIVRSHPRYEGGGLAPGGDNAIVRDGTVIERCALREYDDLRCTPLTEARSWSTWIARGDAVFATDGSELLRRGSGVPWSFSAHGPFNFPPLIAASTVIAGSEDGNVYAVYADDGTPRWTFTPTTPLASPFAMDDRNAYFTSTDGYLHALQRATGTLRWRANPESAVLTETLVDGGTLRYGSEAGTLEALSTDWAEPLWSFDLGSTASAPLVATERGTLVGTTDGWLQMVASPVRNETLLLETESNR